MKQFAAFVKKEFIHIFRDVRTMIILLGMPVIQIVLFGFAITTEVKNTRIAILDPSMDISTRKITEMLDASEYFNISGYIHNADQIDSVFKSGKTGLVIVFGDDFHKELIRSGRSQMQIIADATDPNTATTLINYAGAITQGYQRELLAQWKVQGLITPEIKLLYNPQMKGAYNFVPGVLGMILMLICAMMTSIAIVREKEMGTMEVLLVSPMKPILIIIAKAIPYFAISAVNLTTILLLSIYVLQVPASGSLFWLIMVSLLFIFVSLSLGLLVSTLTDRQMVAMLISGMVFMLPVMLLSGMIYPVENMPAILRWISTLIPARWFILAVKDLMIKGVGITSVLKEIAILGTMALVILLVSLKNFKTRLE